MSGKWTIPALAGRLLGMLKTKQQPAQQLEMDRSRIPAELSMVLSSSRMPSMNSSSPAPEISTTRLFSTSSICRTDKE